MKSLRSLPLQTSPLLNSLPGFVHGFGGRDLASKEILKIAGEDFSALIALRQVHSDTIRRVRRPPRRRPEGDALFTDRPGVLLAVKTADCLPVLLADPVRRIAAAVHCGWKGTALRLVEKTVGVLRRGCGSRPSRLTAALGPCIGPRCYEVGEDVRRAFQNAGHPPDVFRELRGRPGKYLLDLAEANRRLLIRAGVQEDRIEVIPLCTHCLLDYWSYRRDPSGTGRQLSFIGFRPTS